MALMPFLVGVAKAAGASLLSKVADKATDKISGKVVGDKDNPVLTAQQNAQMQGNLNYNSPHEIARHNAFLQGTATAEGQAYNQRQWETRDGDRQQAKMDMEQLTPIRAQTDKAYMDTVYEGTSPWERLGSNAAPSLSAPAPDKGPSGSSAAGQQYLSALTPLATAQIQAQTQKDVANTQARTAEKVAKISQSTELEKTAIHTNQGALPIEQTAQARAQRLLTIAQEDKTYAEGSKIRNDQLLNSMAAVLSTMPTETMDLGIIKHSSKPGWQKIAGILSRTTGFEDRDQQIAQALKSMRSSEFDQVRSDTLLIAGSILQGGKAIGGVTKGFLDNLGKAKRIKKFGW